MIKGYEMPARSYMEERAVLVQKNQYRTQVTLSDKEIALDEKLAQWKAEYVSSYDEGVPYDVPVLTDTKIWESSLYRFCEALPKGSDLHVHGGALLPFDELLAFVLSRDELYVGTGASNWCALVSHETPEEVREDEMHVQEALDRGVISTEVLRAEWTVLGGEQYADIWKCFRELFDKHRALIATPALLEAYSEKVFRYYCDNNIRHLEIRQLFFGTHENAVADAKAIRNAYYRVKKEYPGFVASLFGAGLKYTTRDREITDELLDNALYIHENIKDEFDPANVHDFLIGIDLVNEEDRSRPLMEFAGQLKQIRKDYPKLHLVLHAGESLCASSDNIIDAYLPGAERIGHGLNLYRFPQIMEMVCEDEVCLEVCPVSNQTLRYVSDLRSHPATEYLKRGVPVCLNSDDPAFQEHSALTDDFFAAIVCWDLGIAQIKQLCMNSIRYSSVDDMQKEELMKEWEAQWDAMISHNELFELT